MVQVKTLLSVVALSAACWSVGMAAQAAVDATPPALSLKPTGTFVKGSTISPMAPDAHGPIQTEGIPMQAQWTATDASGICGSSTRQVSDDGYESGWTELGSANKLTTWASDYDNQEGGGGDKVWGNDVRVQDCAGNATVKWVSFAPVVWQEDGSSYYYGTMPARYSGTWSTTKCACWSGGTAKTTSAKGASVTFTVDNPEGPVPAGLVMETAPNRGKVQVLIDGVLKATPDTYARTAAHRKVVWIGTPGTGVHTITVKNLATPGRPRIDVDAVLTSEIKRSPNRAN